MGITDTSPPSAGVCAEKEAWFVGQSWAAGSGTQRCEVPQIPSVGRWWRHTPISLSLSEDLMALPYYSLKVMWR